MNKVDIHGWVKILTSANKDAFLPEYTKVQITEIKNMRTHFKVLDGTNQGMRASREFLSMLGIESNADTVKRHRHVDIFQVDVMRHKAIVGEVSRNLGILFFAEIFVSV